MAAFNTISGLIITSETYAVPNDGRSLRHAEGGEIRGRNAYAETVYEINVVAKGDVNAKQTLLAFYTTYTDIMNTITIDDTDYSVMFLTEPKVDGKDGDIRWMSFTLLGFSLGTPIRVSGIGATGGVGLVIIDIPETVIPSGVTSTSSVGSVGVDLNTLVSVSGIAVTSDVGIVTIIPTIVNLSGITSTSAVGAVTILTP